MAEKKEKMMAQSARDRYHTDPLYKNVVDAMQHLIHSAQMTPSEMREAAILASINYEMMNIRRMHIPMTKDLHERLEELHAIVDTRIATQDTDRREVAMTDEQIKYMTQRFLVWRLPENFKPDAGISFKAEFNENTPYPMKHEPVGTNLFDADQAEKMVRYLVDGLPS